MSSTKEVRFFGPQKDAFRRLGMGRTVTLGWGRGCGKTWFLDTIAPLLVSQWQGPRKPWRPWPGIRIVFLMPSLVQFKDVHGAAFEAMETDWAFLGARLNRTRYSVSFPDGSKILPFPAQQARSASSRGIRTDVVLVDEADDIESSVFHSVCLPWFSRTGSLGLSVLSGTPRKGKNGLLYEMRTAGLDPEKPDCHFIHATAHDCPMLVDPKVVERAKRDSPPAIFRREWLCDFEASEGLVYGEVFDERFHVAEPPHRMRFDEWIVCGDEGWENPGVLLLVGVLGKGADKTYWVLEEIVAQHLDDDGWARKAEPLGERFPGAKLYFDPAAPKLIETIKKTTRGRLRPQEVDKDVTEGIRAVATALKIREDGPGYVPRDGDLRRARLFVHPRCRFTIKEFGSYRRKRDPGGTDSYLEDPIKRDDHAMDALRYGIFNHDHRRTVPRDVPIPDAGWG